MRFSVSHLLDSGYLTSCCQQLLFFFFLNYLLTSLTKEKSSASGVPSSLTNTRTFIQAIGAIRYMYECELCMQWSLLPEFLSVCFSNCDLYTNVHVQLNTPKLLTTSLGKKEVILPTFDQVDEGLEHLVSRNVGKISSLPSEHSSFHVHSSCWVMSIFTSFVSTKHHAQ